MANTDPTNDCESDFTIVDDDLLLSSRPPAYSPPDVAAPVAFQDENAKMSPRASAFTEITNAMELGNEVLSALSAAVDKLYDANRNTTLCVPVLLPDPEKRRRTLGSGDPPPTPTILPKRMKEQVIKMTTSESAGYASCQALTNVLCCFNSMMRDMAEKPGASSDTFITLANTIVAAFHEWTVIRVRLGEDTTYSSIMTMFNLYISHYKTQAIMSLGGESLDEKALSKDSSRSLSDCFKAVRSHPSLHVTKVWAETMETLLPLFVRSCTVPYRGWGANNAAKAYTYHMESLLGEKLNEAGMMIRATTNLSTKQYTPTHESVTGAWVTFAYSMYSGQPVVKSQQQAVACMPIEAKQTGPVNLEEKPCMAGKKSALIEAGPVKTKKNRSRAFFGWPYRSAEHVVR